MPGRRVAASDAPWPDRGPCRVHLITADGASTVPLRPALGTLGIRTRRARERHIVTLYGALTLRTRDPLAAVLEEALEDDSEQIVLDLGDLDSIDRAGLHTILLAHQRASDELKPLVIVPGPPAVQRVFDAAEAPFSYAAARDGAADAAARPRRRRTPLSRSAARRTTRPPSARRTR
jgi:anti-anti-sigma factor